MKTTASSTDVNRKRWSSTDDEWRGYRRDNRDRVIFDERARRLCSLVLPMSPGCRLVDVGCGTGVLTRELARHARVDDILGVDGVDAGATFPVILHELESDAPLPLPDGAFDVVLCLETIEHVHRTNALVRELRRIMKPGGYGIFSVPRIDGFLSIAMLLAGFQPPAVECSTTRRYGSPQPGGRVSGHVSNFTKRAFRELLEDEGLRITGFNQVGMYSSWSFAYGGAAPRWTKLGLWAFSRLPWKQDDMMFRVERRR